MIRSLVGAACTGLRRTHRVRARAAAAVSLAALALAAACSNDVTAPSARSIDGPGARASIGIASVTAVDVYLHAHQDDWQLFMGDHTNASVQSGRRVVLIYTTAGDAGRGSTYWHAREAAAQASADAITPAGTWACATATVNAHPIRRCAKGNLIAYSMRLPDGNADTGTGFGYGSLLLLRDSSRALTAIDSSTTYPTWVDFYTTVGAIITAESQDVAESVVTLNAPDYDKTYNPDPEHKDHRATADAARAALGTHAWPQVWYVDYDIKNRPANLSASDHAVKQAEFSAYDNYMLNAVGETYANDPGYIAYQAATYFRTVGSVTPPPPPPPDTQPPPPPPPPAPISLSATGRKVKGVEYVDLVWSGATGTTVDLWRNSVIVSHPANNASGTTRYTDNTGAKGGHTFTYRVCLTASSTCSSNVTVQF